MHFPNKQDIEVNWGRQCGLFFLHQQFMKTQSVQKQIKANTACLNWPSKLSTNPFGHQAQPYTALIEMKQNLNINTNELAFTIEYICFMLYTTLKEKTSVEYLKVKVYIWKWGI